MNRLRKLLTEKVSALPSSPRMQKLAIDFIPPRKLADKLAAKKK